MSPKEEKMASHLSLIEDTASLVDLTPRCETAVNQELNSDLPELKVASEPSAGAAPGNLALIKSALDKLEAFSLRSSEDINDAIEQLITCFN